MILKQVFTSILFRSGHCYPGGTLPLAELVQRKDLSLNSIWAHPSFPLCQVKGDIRLVHLCYRLLIWTDQCPCQAAGHCTYWLQKKFPSRWLSTKFMVALQFNPNLWAIPNLCKVLLNLQEVLLWTSEMRSVLSCCVYCQRGVLILSRGSGLWRWKQNDFHTSWWWWWILCHIMKDGILDNDDNLDAMNWVGTVWWTGLK